MSLLASTLVIGICSGCVGVLVDIDHVIAHKFHKDYRFLHKYYLMASLVIIICCGTYLARLHY